MPLWYQVLDLKPSQALVLGPHGDREALAQGLPWPTWTFVLRELGDGATRLIVGMRSDFTPTPLGVLAKVRAGAGALRYGAQDAAGHQGPRRTGHRSDKPVPAV
jgi:hypothetical protein